jgi:hypothetical protein
MQAQQISELASAGFFRGTRAAECNEAGAEGVISFRSFSLDKQRKGPRPQPRSGGAKKLNLWILAFARMTNEILDAGLRRHDDKNKEPASASFTSLRSLRFIQRM